MPLFETSDEALTEVIQDLTTGFEGVFETVEDVRAVGVFTDEAVGTVSEVASVLAWEWTVQHVGPLQGTPATLKELTVRGVTVIDGSGPRLTFSRYIDWMGLYAQIGAVTIARPPVDDRHKIEGNVPHDVPVN
jgi:hypothetical protein